MSFELALTVIGAAWLAWAIVRFVSWLDRGCK